ncbi:MAG: hypothetical protein Ct9H300mP28_14600 [Pseudomonadota bacterium]|nr:MAG: hypothetical protein Ct9H300mP28_14600 [Pseudomonadota bacterium]
MREEGFISEQELQDTIVKPISLIRVHDSTTEATHIMWNMYVVT